MSLIHSPKIVTNGLAFCIDFSNIKSFKGRPTTNLYSNGHFADGQHVVQANNGINNNPLNEIIMMPNPGSSPYCLRQTGRTELGGSQYTEYQLDYDFLVAGNTYCMSCWVAYTEDWNGSTTSIFHSRWYNSSGVSLGEISPEAGTAIETKVINGLTWTRRYKTFTAGTGALLHDWFLGYNSGNTTGYRYFTDIQLEVGSVPSKFVDGVRSNTEVILDMTGNNTIYANSLSYGVNAALFNGTSNYITCAAPVGLPSGQESGTVLVWCKPDQSVMQPTAYAGLVSYGGRSESDSRLLSIYAATNPMYVSSAYWNNDYVPNSLAIDNNQWNMIGMISRGTGIANNTTLICGNSSGLNYSTGSSTNYTLPLNTVLSNLSIGCTDYPGRYFGGQIDIVQIYNRELSTTEIQQNYDALRGRYGL